MSSVTDILTTIEDQNGPPLRDSASAVSGRKFSDLPPEILLHICQQAVSFSSLVLLFFFFTKQIHPVSYLDLPDLTLLASLGSRVLASLTADPVLHFQRLWVTSPSRLNHHLFGRSKEGHLLRPSVGELVRRGVMKGLGIERRWRMGMYFYSSAVSLTHFFILLGS